MAKQSPLGVISIGSNDIHLLVATSDGVGTFDWHTPTSAAHPFVEIDNTYPNRRMDNDVRSMYSS